MWHGIIKNKKIPLTSDRPVEPPKLAGTLKKVESSLNRKKKKNVKSVSGDRQSRNEFHSKKKMNF